MKDRSNEQTQRLPVPPLCIKRSGSDEILVALTGEAPVKGKGTIRFAISSGELRAKIEGDQIQIEMAEELAATLAEALFDMAGRISAVRSTHLIRQAKGEKTESNGQ
jgi:hypothetical protein